MRTRMIVLILVTILFSGCAVRLGHTSDAGHVTLVDPVDTSGNAYGPWVIGAMAVLIVIMLTKDE